MINYNPPTFGEKVGELWASNKKVIEVHIDPPKWTFFWTQYLGPYRDLGVLHPKIFLRALEVDPSYLANTPTGTGIPQKSLIAKI